MPYKIVPIHSLRFKLWHQNKKAQNNITQTFRNFPIKCPPKPRMTKNKTTPSSFLKYRARSTKSDQKLNSLPPSKGKKTEKHREEKGRSSRDERKSHVRGESRELTAAKKRILGAPVDIVLSIGSVFARRTPQSRLGKRGERLQPRGSSAPEQYHGKEWNGKEWQEYYKISAFTISARCYNYRCRRPLPHGSGARPSRNCVHAKLGQSGTDHCQVSKKGAICSARRLRNCTFQSAPIVQLAFRSRRAWVTFLPGNEFPLRMDSRTMARWMKAQGRKWCARKVRGSSLEEFFELWGGGMSGGRNSFVCSEGNFVLGGQNCIHWPIHCKQRTGKP